MKRFFAIERSNDKNFRHRAESWQDFSLRSRVTIRFFAIELSLDEIFRHTERTPQIRFPLEQSHIGRFFGGAGGTCHKVFRYKPWHIAE
jgi:hypothetical protein